MVQVNEQKCETQYETVYEEVCEGGAPQQPQCTTVQVTRLGKYLLNSDSLFKVSRY